MTALRPALLLSTLLLMGAPCPADDAPEDPLVRQLRERLAKGDREAVRQELLGLAGKKAGRPVAVQASRLLSTLPSPMDALDANSIPELDRFAWQPRELVAVLGEHRGRQGSVINAVAYTRDGKRVISGGGNGYVRIFDSTTLRQWARVGTGHSTLCVAVSRDGNTVAAGSNGGGLYVWDIAGEQPVSRGTFQVGTSPVYSVDISPDGKLLAAGVYDGLVHLYDLSEKQAKVKTQLTGHKTPVKAVAFAPQPVGAKSYTLATGGTEGIIDFWTVGEAVKEGPRTEAHGKEILSLAWSPSGKFLAAGLADGNVWLWNAGVRPTRRAVFKAHTGNVAALTYHPGGNTLATASSDGSVRFWSLATAPRQTGIIEGHAGAVNGLAYAGDGKSLATGSADWTARLWNLTGPRPAERFPPRGHLSAAHDIDVAPDGKAVASGSEDHTTRIWDPTKAAPVQSALFRDTFQVYCVAFSPDGKGLAVAGNHTAGKLYDSVKRSPLRNFAGHPGQVNRLGFSSDGNWVATVSGTVMLLFNANTGREIHRFDGHDQPISALAVSPDGQYALTGTGQYLKDDKGKYVIKNGQYVYTDCTLRLFDLKRGRQVKSVTGLERPVYSLAYSPLGTRVACGMWERTTRMFEVSEDDVRALEEIKGTSVWVHLQAFSPDGRRLATVGRDGRLVLIEPDTGKVAWQWTPQEAIRNVAFSSDSRYLAVSIYTGPVYILRLANPGPGG